jgi:hypothetical protein
VSPRAELHPAAKSGKAIRTTQVLFQFAALMRTSYQYA